MKRGQKEAVFMGRKIEVIGVDKVWRAYVDGAPVGLSSFASYSTKEAAVYAARSYVKRKAQN